MQLHPPKAAVLQVYVQQANLLGVSKTFASLGKRGWAGEPPGGVLTDQKPGKSFTVWGGKPEKKARHSGDKKSLQSTSDMVKIVSFALLIVFTTSVAGVVGNIG